jgi:hypothetical protein
MLLPPSGHVRRKALLTLGGAAEQVDDPAERYARTPAGILVL